MFDFEPFDKIARLRRELVVTEKLDGTNAQVAIFEIDDASDWAGVTDDPYCIATTQGIATGESPLAMYAGSRSRYIAPEGSVQDQLKNAPKKGTDNFGFARWVQDNCIDLFKLGPGRHYGEWYGKGIQRGYGLEEKRFALFNTARWGAHNPNTPGCCEVVTRLDDDPEVALSLLACMGSKHVPGYLDPEGIVVYHTASRTLYKQTFDQDGGKWQS